MNKALKQPVIMLTVIFICFSLCYTSFAATKKDTKSYYRLTNVRLTYNSSTGQVRAYWNETTKATDKVVMLYQDGILIKTETVTGICLDLSKDILSAGEGTYYVSVYPSKLGKEYHEESEELIITSDRLKKINEFDPSVYEFYGAKLVYDETAGTIKATWNYGERKTTAKVLLYKGESQVDTWVTATSNSYDFSSVVAKKGAGNYTFKVYPITIGDKYTEESDQLTVTSDMQKKLKVRVEAQEKEKLAKRTGWYHNGPTNIWYYYKTPGEAAKKEWLTLNGKTYHFSSSGIMNIGWQVIDNAYYYFDSNGGLVKDATTPDGCRVNSQGQYVDEGGNVVSAEGEKEAPAVPTDLLACAISVNETARGGPGTVKNVSFKAGTGFEIKSVKYSADYSGWTAGNPVRVTVTVCATTNYSFATGVKFTVRNCKNISSTGNLKERTVVFSYYPKMQLKAPEMIHLSGTEYLCWKPVDKARRYKVVITQDGTTLLSSVVTENKVSLSGFVTLEEDASAIDVKIYAMGSTSNTSYLQTSAAAAVTDLYKHSLSYTLKGELKWNNVGLRYYDDSGEVYKGWVQLFGSWYYFRTSGYAAGPGWIQDENTLWYYFDSDHKLCTGRITVDGKEYFLNDGSRTNLPLGAWVKE